MSQAANNPRSFAREYALQFLYQSEMEKVFYFDESRFNSFADSFILRAELINLTREIADGVLKRITEIDSLLSRSSSNWSIGRMSIIDRNVLRIAVYELMGSSAPTKVILNEAIQLAKTYGSENSGRFVNGVLDPLARELRTNKAVGQ
jgi:N utilization substance protein B